MGVRGMMGRDWRGRGVEEHLLAARVCRGCPNASSDMVVTYLIGVKRRYVDGRLRSIGLGD